MTACVICILLPWQCKNSLWFKFTMLWWQNFIEESRDVISRAILSFSKSCPLRNFIFQLISVIMQNWQHNWTEKSLKIRRQIDITTYQIRKIKAIRRYVYLPTNYLVHKLKQFAIFHAPSICSCRQQVLFFFHWNQKYFVDLILMIYYHNLLKILFDYTICRNITYARNTTFVQLLTWFPEGRIEYGTL